MHTLREEKKLVWSVGASNITQEGRGIFAIFAECDAKNRPLVAPAVQSILHGLKKHPPTQEEIRRAKNLIQTSWLQGYETFHNQASTLGSYALDHHLAATQRVSAENSFAQSGDLKRVIDAYFSQDLRGAVVEP